jgi:hypothetical protein
MFAELKPDLPAPQRDKTISADRILLSFSITKSVRAKLQKLEELSGRPHDLEMLFELMLDATLEKYEKKRGESGPRQPAPVATPQPSTAAVSQDIKSRRKYISIHTQRDVWRRASCQCEYTEASTGKRCEQRRFLQLDHVYPISKGGSDAEANLQLLCANHNLAKGSTIVKETFARRKVIPNDRSTHSQTEPFVPAMAPAIN